MCLDSPKITNTNIPKTCSMQCLPVFHEYLKYLRPPECSVHQFFWRIFKYLRPVVCSVWQNKCSDVFALLVQCARQIWRIRFWSENLFLRTDTQSRWTTSWFQTDHRRHSKTGNRDHEQEFEDLNENQKYHWPSGHVSVFKMDVYRQLPETLQWRCERRPARPYGPPWSAAGRALTEP